MILGYFGAIVENEEEEKELQECIESEHPTDALIDFAKKHDVQIYDLIDEIISISRSIGFKEGLDRAFGFMPRD